MKETTKSKLKKAVQFLFNPRFLICWAIAWLITNGWSYILFGIGAYLKIDWMMAVSGAYIAFLWIPATPEKLVTVTIAIALLRWLFPSDQKTLAVLRSLYDRTKAIFRRKREEHVQRRQKKTHQKIKEDPHEP